MLRRRKASAHFQRNPQNLKYINLSQAYYRVRGTSYGGRKAQQLFSILFSMSSHHPPGKNKLTKLIVFSKHISLSVLGTSYHIGSGSKKTQPSCIICVTCHKISAQTEKQLMGQLPSQRVTPSAVFSTTGMDFAGPFIIKKEHTRKPVLTKGYVCVFVCFTTKAAHLEAVSDVTTEAFTATRRCFIARRRLSQELFSENGSRPLKT